MSIGLLTGENGIITQAQESKKRTEIAKEKEIVGLAVTGGKGENGWGEILEDNLKKELNNNAGEGKTEVTDIGDEFEVIFKDSNRYYIVDKNGNVGESQEIIKDKNPGDITTGKDGEQLDGSEEKPYEIWCIEDLVEWSQNYNKYSKSNIKLCRDLNFKSPTSYADSTTIKYGDINKDNSVESIIEELQEGEGFSPIEVFSGTFNGNNKWIKNIYIYKNRFNIGLFSVISSSANILNLSITGRIINDAKNSAGIAGSISGAGEGGIIDNCHNYCEITSAGYSGGIIGYINETAKFQKISNCSNHGTLTVGSIGYIGGIVANTDSTTLIIEGCYNKGYVKGSGIAGNNKSIIRNCYNLGEVNYGLVEANQNIIENCYNIGKCNKGFIVANNFYTNSYVYKCFYANDTANSLTNSDNPENLKNVDATCKSMERSEMQKESFIEELNQNKNEKVDIWKKDFNNINNGFPIFKWQN